MSGHRHHGAFRGGHGPWWGGGFGRFQHGWGWSENPPGGGGAFGHFGRGFGHHQGGRKFGRGDLKYVILDLLKDQPRHGYDVIRALEERSHGFYSPSPGSVYPILQLLEDQGYVASEQQAGKRVYAITDEGRRFLEERAEAVGDVHARMAGGWGQQATPEMRQLVHEVGQIGQFLFRQGAHGALNDPEKVKRLRAVVARARSEIEAIFTGETSSRETML
jgi:DNA-binding PadR family transcriptional regulator